jgi:hypothetical protein
MPNKLDIINAALVSLGASPVQDLSSTTPSVAAAAFWPMVLPATLRSHPWNFAVTRRTLAPLATAPDHGYSQAFPLPSDWIRTLSCSADDFRMEGGKILCDATILELRYIAMVEDPARWDGLFCEAIAAHLAAKLAYPLTQSASAQEVCWSAYKEILRLARSVDSLEEPTDDIEESSLITLRR